MKTLLILLVLALPAAAYAQVPTTPQTPTVHQAPQQQRIQITSTLARIALHGEGVRVQFYLLWNKGIRNRPIGHAFYQCQEAHAKTLVCTSVFSLPLGKIASMGEVRRNRSSLVITGGTGFYQGADGVLNSVRIGPGTYSLSFRLEIPR